MIAAPGGYESVIAAVARAAVGDGDLGLDVVAGGLTRGESVGRALAEVDSELVTVHDAARPLVSAELIESLIGRLSSRPDADAVVPAAPVADTIKRVSDDGETVAATEDRELLRTAQTPQVFRTARLREAHARDPGSARAATDDATLIESAGGTVLVEPGPSENLKVTTPADLRLAEALLGERDAPRPSTWIRRVMPNLPARDLEASRRFYTEFLGLAVAMDEPGFLMLFSPSHPTSELTVSADEQREWDPNTGRTQMAIEVADVDASYEEARSRGLPIVYPLTDEPWGIRRFFVEDPDGTVINVHSHIDDRDG